MRELLPLPRRLRILVPVVDVIVQTPSQGGKTDLAFTCGRIDLEKAESITRKAAKAVAAGKVEMDADIAKVSIVGVGMRNHAGVAAKMFEVLSAEKINIRMITTSEIKVSCIVDQKYGELAVRALHTAFGLDSDPAVENG